MRLKYIYGIIYTVLCIALLPGLTLAQKHIDLAKSVRVNNYSLYISDNTINSQGLSNSIEMYNYHFINTTTASLLSFGEKNKYYSAQNVFSYFTNGNAKIKIPVCYGQGETQVYEIVKLFWDPKNKMWAPMNVPSRFPPKDTLVIKDVTDKFFVTGLGIMTYKNKINVGAEAYVINKSGDYPDRNLQISLVSSFFKQSKLSAFVHADLLLNRTYARNNPDKLYFFEGELTARGRIFSVSVNYGYGKSIFRYALLDNGFLEFAPIFLKYQYGIKTTITIPSFGSSLFFNISQSYYYEPDNKSAFTSYYAGIKIPLKKY